jgi:hypothetical protein
MPPLVLGQDLVGNSSLSVDAEGLGKIFNLILVVLLVELRHLLKGGLLIEANDLIPIQNMFLLKIMFEDL